MFIVNRTMKVNKEFTDSVLERLEKPSVISSFDGYLKTEIFVDKKNKEYDVVLSIIYFKSKTDFYRWEGSPEHIAMHKDKNHQHNKKQEGVIEVTRSSYDHVQTKHYINKWLLRENPLFRGFFVVILIRMHQ